MLGTEQTSSKVDVIAQRMISKGNSFEGALGAAIMYGEYKDRRKIINAFPRLWERFENYNYG